MEQAFGVVITGAAGGVGFAYADEFLGRGHKVGVRTLESILLPIPESSGTTPDSFISHPTLEVTQGQISSQSPTYATRWWHLYGS